VGDGVTDLETKPVVDLFIGFGGVHVRPRVKENAPVFVTDFASVLKHLMS
jgi:phosphoserine phosphatase